ncbi:MAG: hypothetical protein U9Q72_02955 [Patescibacteria group bacterium]|nr:hypothetical protein [Patescibacteria group bacterium]
MKNKILTMVLAVGLLAVLPAVASAKDENSGERAKIKEGKVMSVIPEKGLIVVKKNGHLYNFNLALSDPSKTELLSKYGVNVDFFELEPDDRITCRGRRFPQYFVPSKCRVEVGSQDKLYRDKKGIIVVDVYGVDPVNNLIYAAHSLNKVDVTTIKKGDAKITYEGENRSLSKLESYWRLHVKGEWDKSQGIFKRVEYIRIKQKHKTEPAYGY